MYIYIYILDARERAKARSLLDPSDQCDAKAFSPPIFELEFPILTSEPQLVLLLVPVMVPVSAFYSVSTEQQFLERWYSATGHAHSHEPN